MSDQRNAELGFTPQKENIYSKYLPYSDVVDAESTIMLSQIKLQLARSIELRDIKVSTGHWVGQLTRYIRVYGRKFSKQDHVLFVKFLYEIVTIPDVEANLVVKCANMLQQLLKKVNLLTRDDLVLPWRPLYRLVNEKFYECHPETKLRWFPTNIDLVMEKLVRNCQVYFAAEATSEMLEEWRPLLCPYDTMMMKGMSCLDWFLPVNTPPNEHAISFKLWFSEFMDIWESLHSSPIIETMMVQLFSRLALNNISYIDWEPYIPQIFTRILRNFSLPIGSKISITVSRSGSCYLETETAIWVASMLGGGSSTQAHIDKFFIALKSFYHPSNTGNWTISLAKWLVKLPEAVVDRIHRERYADQTWRTPVLDSHKLTDDDLAAFVLSMRPVVFMGMFSKVCSYQASQAIQLLSWLQPHLVLPQLLETAYPALETLTEPHRLLSCINTIIGAARPLISSPSFPEGRTHVLPLLHLCLPGLDPNDLKKSLVTLQMICAFSLLVPIVDTSDAIHTRDDLTQIEKDVCSSTAQFEDFVLHFMERLFSLIEINASDHSNHQVNRPAENLNIEMVVLGSGLVSTFSALLWHCSPQIFQVALDKLFNLVRGTVYETKIGGRFVSDLCRSAACTNPKVTLKKFVPHLCSKIREAIETHENLLTDEQLDDEFLWNLQMLSKIVRCEGSELLPYLGLVKSTLASTLKLRSNVGYSLAGHLLKNTLITLTSYYNLDYSELAGETDLPIRNWAREGDLNNLSVSWHVPSEAELDAAQDLVDTFLTPILEYLTNVTKDVTIDREELEKQLSILAEILLGVGAVAGALQGEPVILRESQVPLMRVSCTSSCNPREITASGKHLRRVIADLLTPLLGHMLEHCEDNTKSFFKLIKVYSTVLLCFGVLKEDFDVHWKSYHYVKHQLEDKLRRHKTHMKSWLVTRIQRQHEMRVLNDARHFTPTHTRLLHDLFTLSTSRYSYVRKKAQTVLSSAFMGFPYSYRILLDPILANLAPDPSIPEYKYKGSMHIIKGQGKRCIATKLSWEVLNRVWPVVVRAQHGEKPSLQRLKDDVITKICDNFETIAIASTVSAGCLEAAHRLRMSITPHSPDSTTQGSICDVDTSTAEEFERRLNEHNLRLHRELETNLVDLVNSGTLMWKFEEDALELLAFLLRHDVKPSPATVSVFVGKLLDESYKIRLLAIAPVSSILYQLKRPRKKVTMTASDISEREGGAAGEDARRSWLKYQRERLPTSKDKWDKMIFVDKTHWGYNVWPKELSVRAPASEQHCDVIPYDEMNDCEKVIHDFFIVPSNVVKLLRDYLSLEGNKKDKLRRINVSLFLGVFRNYGNTFLESFKPQMERLMADTDPNRVHFNQRCVMEVLAGLIRGSKSWPFDKLEAMWSWVIGVLRKAAMTMTAETIDDWKKFYRTLSENRDPRRLFWLFEFLLEAPLSGEGGSFGDYSRLMTIQQAVVNQEWRVPDIQQRLVDYLVPRIGHPYNIVRDAIASLLSSIYMFDYTVATRKVDRLSLSRSDLVQAVLPQMEILKYESPSQTNLENTDELDKREATSSEPKAANSHENNHYNLEAMEIDSDITDDDMDDGHKEALRICKTMLQYVANSVWQTVTASTPELVSLMPVFCAVCKSDNTSEDTMKKKASVGLACMAQCYLDDRTLATTMDMFKQVSKMTMWHARLVLPVYIQIAVFQNLFIINQSHHKNDITAILLGLICDERLEVRECATEAVSGLLQCGYISLDKALMRRFMSQSQTRLDKIRAASDKTNNITSTTSSRSDTTTSSASSTSSSGTTANPCPDNSTALVRRHAGVLGLCAIVQAHPYDVPKFIPEVLMTLSNHVNDPQPIQATVNKTLTNFRRTHHDNWHDHKQKFTDDQLVILTDLLVSPNYYA